MRFFGLTGGIGSGKSTALSLLAELGCATLSTDQMVHEIQQKPDVIGAFVGRFGSEVIGEDGIDRAAVARIVFSDPKQREWIESLIWPLVGSRIAEWRKQVEGQVDPVRAAVIEVPLLFESGMDAAFDGTIAVSADDTLREKRVAERGQEAVAEREARQLSQSDKAERSTWSVVNDGSIADLRLKLSGLLAKIGV